MVDIILSAKQMKPAVVHTNQFEDGVYKLRFTIDNYMQNDGKLDLRNFKAYAVTSIMGHIDITEIPYTVSGQSMILTWDVTSWTLKEDGVIQYQIRFSESAEDGTAVWYSYKGILVNRLSIPADDHVSANYPTLLKQWIDRMQQLSSVIEGGESIFYMPVGEPLDVLSRVAGKLYYQIENASTYEGHFEDHLGNRIGDFNAHYVTNADMNTMLESGEYICGGTLTNMPVSSTYCMVRVTDSASTNRIIQEVYVPANDNTVRAFVRAGTGSGATPFGAWNELATVGYVDAMVQAKDFEIKSLMAMEQHGLTDLYIDTFEDISSLNTVPGGYDTNLNQFNITSTGDMIFTVKKASNAFTKFWVSVDYANVSSGSVTPQVSVDSGSSWITLANNALTTVTSATNFIVKLKFSGSLTLKNVAFGLK